MPDNIIDIRGLKKYYPVKGGIFKRHIADVKAVDDINLSIRRGECLGLVGESGCGKTTLGKAILRLHDATAGRIYLNQQNEAVEQVEAMLESGNSRQMADAKNMLQKMDLNQLSRQQMLKLRKKIQIVFQDPSNSLDPRMLIKNIISEPLQIQGDRSAAAREDKVLDLLNTVGMGKDHMMRYAHEFSGGQRQRIAIARAMATNPEFILMDEPTSALDVSVQAQILNLLKKLQDDFSLTYLFVTHHLLVVKYISDRIAVMYLGKMIEISKTGELFDNPVHPYTKALLSAIPTPDVDISKERMILTGDVPNPLNPPSGCRFHPRCPFAKSICKEAEPVIEEVSSGHQVACHRWRQL